MCRKRLWFSIAAKTIRKINYLLSQNVVSPSDVDRDVWYGVSQEDSTKSTCSQPFQLNRDL